MRAVTDGHKAKVIERGKSGEVRTLWLEDDGPFEDSVTLLAGEAARSPSRG